MTAARCRFCQHPATGTVTAPKKAPIPHCDTCWEQAYDIVQDLLPHTWKLIESGHESCQLDLFDLIQEGNETA